MIDAFSFFGAGHPVTQPGAIRYLLAPPWPLTATPLPLGEGLEPALFRRQMRAWPRAAGGLLPMLGLPERTLAEALDDPWWRALLLAPGPPGLGLADAAVLEALEWPEAEMLPVVVECGLEGFSRPAHLRALLDRLPPRPVVLTHGGQLNISGGHLEAAAELFRLYPQTLLETSGIYRQDWLESMLAAIGPGRILYGSGFPRMDEEMELARVTALPAGPEARGAMLGGNAARVFGLEA